MADDSLLLREGLVRVLVEAGLEVVGSYGDGTTLLEDLPQVRPDLAVLDVRMPPTFRDEGVRAAIRARELLPGFGILLESLTPREREVLTHMANGRTNSAIAAAMAIGVGAVEKNVTSIFQKLGLDDSGSDHRRVLAVLTWLQR